MNYTANNPGPIGTKGLKWITDPVVNGRVITFTKVNEVQRITGLDPTKAYMLSAISAGAAEIKADAIPFPSRPTGGEKGANVDLSVSVGAKQLGGVVNSGSITLTATELPPAPADHPVVTKFGGPVSLRLVEVPLASLTAPHLIDGTALS